MPRGRNMGASDNLPTVTHEGIVKIGDLEIKVLRLSNGKSVIEEGSMHVLLAALFDGLTPPSSADQQ